MPEGWNLLYENYEPEKEGVREALCVLGNGYFTVRGAIETSIAGNIHYPGTYLAGGYNRLKTEIAGQVIENEDLVNFPNWLSLNFKIDNGDWFDLDSVEILSYQQKLNIKEGILTRVIKFRDEKSNEILVTMKRLVSMDNHHIAAIEMTIEAINWSGELEILSALDGRVTNAGVERYQQLNNKHLESIDAGFSEDNTIYLQVRTNHSHISMAQAARTELYLNDCPIQTLKNENRNSLSRSLNTT